MVKPTDLLRTEFTSTRRSRQDLNLQRPGFEGRRLVQLGYESKSSPCSQRTHPDLQNYAAEGRASRQRPVHALRSTARAVPLRGFAPRTTTFGESCSDLLTEAIAFGVELLVQLEIMTTHHYLGLLSILSFVACTPPSILDEADASDRAVVRMEAGSGLLASRRQDATGVAPSDAGGGGDAQFTIYFSPRGGCTSAIVAFIHSAKKSIRVSAYSFSSTPIVNALLEQHQDGIDVEVILDKSDVGSTQLQNLVAAHVPTWIDDKHHIAHNKVILVDHQRVETGSFNYSFAAEDSNAENCLIIRDVGLTAQYEANWTLHQGHSITAGLGPFDAGRD